MRGTNSQSRAVLSSDPVKAHLPSGVRATENIGSLCPERTRGLLPKSLKDPRVVQCYPKIQLRPTCHLALELLKYCLYALKGYVDYYH